MPWRKFVDKVCWVNNHSGPLARESRFGAAGTVTLFASIARATDLFRCCTSLAVVDFGRMKNLTTRRRALFGTERRSQLL